MSVDSYENNECVSFSSQRHSGKDNIVCTEVIEYGTSNFDELHILKSYSDVRTKKRLIV